MDSQPSCPNELALIRFVSGQLSAEESDQWGQHLADCSRCREAIEWIRQHPQRPDTSSSCPSEPSEPSAAVSPRRLPWEEEGEDRSETELAADLGRLGKYEVVAVVGKGAFGTVFKAYDKQLRRMVALKVLKRSVAENATARRRFIREARAGATISHANVVTIFAVEEMDDLPLLVMEFVSGRTLRERIRMRPRLDLIEIVRISAQIALGLAAAHGQGVVHRDVKPSNVLLENGVERVKLSDFGLATCTVDNVDLTSGNLAVGTPAYMAPEQANAGIVDGRADLFGLGCVIYAMVTGDSPFLEKTSWATSRKIVEWDPPRLNEVDPQIPTALSDIVARLLQKEAADRYGTAAEVAQLLNDQLIAMNQLGPLESTRRHWSDRGLHASSFAGIGLLAVTLLAIVGIALSNSQRTSAVTPRITRAQDHDISNGVSDTPARHSSPAEYPLATNEEALTTANLAPALELSVWQSGNSARQGRSVRERGTLPISDQDGLRVDVRLRSALYAHLLWIDAQGELYPVYPWRPGEWNGAAEAQPQPVRSISLPEPSDVAWPNSGTAGMETLVLLASPDPPDASLDFHELLADFPRIPISEDRKLFEFDQDGRLWEELDRSPKFSQSTPIGDHVQQTTQFIRQRLAPHFSVVRVLRFANQGPAE